MELNDLDIKMNQYINGELTGKALQDFEQLLLNNKELAKEVALHKTIDQSLKASKTNQNKSALNKLFQQFGEQYILNEPEEASRTKVIELHPEELLVAEKNNKGMLRWLAPLVSIAAAALFIFYMGFGNTNSKQLAEQNFEPYIFDVTFRNARVDNLILAQQAYDDKNYEKALPLLSKYTDNSDALMAKGNCEFLLDKPDEAIETFKQLSNKNIDVHQKAIAQWYLALSYLKQNHLSLAKNELTGIPKSSPYYQKAQSLLKKMK